MNGLPDTLELVQDRTAKSEAYYSRSAAPVITDEVVAALKARLARSGGTSVRICLHAGPESAFHEMVIVHKKGGAFKPHKHLAKDESYHMIEGVLGIEIYDEPGRLVQTVRLGGPGTGLPFWIRIRPGVWHATVPETDFAVFHEARPGPFKGGDSVFRNDI